MCSAVRVWSRFQRSLKDGSVIKYRIEQCPDNRLDELSDFMCKYFMRDEVWNKAIGIANEDLAVEEFLKLQRSFYPKKLCQICVVDDGSAKPEMVGFNGLDIVKKNEKHHNLFEPKSKAITTLFKMFKEIDKHNDIFERFDADAYITGAGMSVSPNHRNRGIAGELLKARVALAESIGVKVVAASFTSTASQAVAHKQGYQVIYEVDYEELCEKIGAFVDTDAKTFKLMAYVTKK